MKMGNDSVVVMEAASTVSTTLLPVLDGFSATYNSRQYSWPSKETGGEVRCLPFATSLMPQ